MTSTEIRKKFLKFFKERGHAVLPSSSLIPDDPSVLLTTAGMQQFKKYFTGELDAKKDFRLPDGTPARGIASIQKCFRTSDIDEVGDESHLTFFEMLGNFSFGGYFKEEAIKLAYEFITSEEWMNLKIDYVSVFGGDSEVPEDSESEKIWQSLGVTDIRKASRKDNFWGPTGAEGPCGPTTEIYVNSALRQAQGKPPVEVWNIVFNQYYKHSDGKLEKLKTLGVDTGMGLERLAMMVQKKKNIFETDLFAEPIENLGDLPIHIRRIIADHIRAISFLVSDGVHPSNKGRDYILRRLMRRVIAYEQIFSEFKFNSIRSKTIFEIFANKYDLKLPIIINEFNIEHQKFSKTLRNGLKELEKLSVVDAISAFKLYESYGLPYEVIKELGGGKAKKLNLEDFNKEFAKHQEISRVGAEKKFGGHGLILDTGELKAGNEEELKKVLRLHTATHLLQQALRDALGPEVRQMGSDITPERTRFDFAFPRKLTPEEIKKTEDIINKKIKEDLPVGFKEIPKAEAEKSGALYYFKEKYPEKVKVYFVGKDIASAWSKEFCGGPHVTHTGEIGTFKIAKEESVGAGIRRIRGVVKQ